MSTSLLYDAFRVRGCQYQRTEYAGGGLIFGITQPREGYCCAVRGSRDLIGKGKNKRRFRTLPIEASLSGLPCSTGGGFPRVRARGPLEARRLIDSTDKRSA